MIEIRQTECVHYKKSLASSTKREGSLHDHATLAERSYKTSNHLYIHKKHGNNVNIQDKNTKQHLLACGKWSIFLPFASDSNRMGCKWESNSADLHNTSGTEIGPLHLSYWKVGPLHTTKHKINGNTHR